MYRIISATARPGFLVDLTWEDGSRSSIDFRPLLQGEVFAPLRDPAWFAAHVAVEEDGHALGWPGELHFSADSLWYRTHPEDLKRDYPEAAAE
ncbi:MAG TPA: DUF2442 domain-containing protein [Azospirillaceae bacterium]|nr:DUF2442 domain-containing protein [Azospirillaceae bacterium]